MWCGVVVECNEQHLEQLSDITPSITTVNLSTHSDDDL